MTRNEARMIAEELHKLIQKDIIERIDRITSEALDKTLSVSQAAEYLGCKPQTIYNNISDIPHFKVGRFLRFSERSLAEYLRAQGRYQ